MSVSSQTTHQAFPFEHQSVFRALVQVIPELGMSIRSRDETLGRISVSAEMSLFSWGENVTIIVDRTRSGLTDVCIESALKFGLNVAGVQRHQRNFDKIISALSEHLQARYPVIGPAASTERSCPFCAEAIKAEAKICRFCNRESTQVAALESVPEGQTQLSNIPRRFT